MKRIDPDAPASLIWLAPDETATADNFTSAKQSWTLEAAVTHARQVVRDHDKVPWIMVGSDVLGPSQIDQVATGLRAMNALR